MTLGSFMTNGTPCFVNSSIATGSLTANSFSVLKLPDLTQLFSVTDATTTIWNNLVVATGSTSNLADATATTLNVGTATIGTLAGNAYDNLKSNIAAKRDIFSVNTPLKFASGVLSLDTTTLTNVACSGTLQATGATTMQTTLNVTGLTMLSGGVLSLIHI